MEKRKFKVHHHVARKLIEHAREQERHVTPEELDDLWRHVEEQVFIEKRKNSRRHILYVTTALSAAVIFFGFIGCSNLLLHILVRQTIYSFLCR